MVLASFSSFFPPFTPVFLDPEPAPKGLEGLAEACGSTMKSRSAWTLHKTELASVREQCRWLLWQRFRLGVPCHSVEHDGCTLSLRFLLSAQPSPAVSYRHRLQVQSPSFNTRRQRSMISSQSSTTFRWLLSQDKQPPPRPQGVYGSGHTGTVIIYLKTFEK